MRAVTYLYDKYIVVYTGVWSVTYSGKEINPGGTVGLRLVLEGSHRGFILTVEERKKVIVDTF